MSFDEQYILFVIHRKKSVCIEEDEQLTHMSHEQCGLKRNRFRVGEYDFGVLTMKSKTTWIFIILLIVAVFILAPLMLPSEENYSEEYAVSEEAEDEDFDIDFKKKKTVAKSARAVGGSGSFRSGK